MSKRKTTDEFIAEARRVHGNKYDYSKAEYKNNREKVIIICPEHGEFLQSPEKHLSGQGCPVCGGTKKNTTCSFIEKARKIHGDKYDYSKVEYVTNKDKVCIICPEHGEFWQDPHNHLKGKGCPLCGDMIHKPAKYTTDTFIIAAKESHGDKYDYSKTVYKNMNEPVEIICAEHGPFFQLPYLHLGGSICPSCSRKLNGVKRRITKEEFIERAKTVHGDKYDYSKVEYVTEKHKVCIICPEHGEFWQTPDKHLQGNGCPKCVYPYSKAENEILEYVKDAVSGENVIAHDRAVLGGRELDIFIPSKNVAIEYNGLYWHDKDRNYHLKKTEDCNALGISLIQVFEDEYLYHKDIVLSKISHILGVAKSSEKIMARKCTVSEIGKETAERFLTENHIQGFVSSTVYLGAEHCGETVGVMSFKKTGEQWELTRFATKTGVLSCGLGGKLFSAFIRKYSPHTVKTFADRRWTVDKENNLYTKLGFSFVGYTKPEYRYYRPGDGPVRQHKFGFRKEILHRKHGLPLSMTETEMTSALGYVKIYDCGLMKYVWTKKEDSV